MKQSFLHGCLILIGLLFLGMIGLYVAFAKEYEGKFLLGTYINGIDVGGRTAQEVKTRLASLAENYAADIQLRGTRETETLRLSAADFGLRYASEEEVDALLQQQSIWEWPKAFMGTKWEYEAALETTYETDMLYAAFQKLLNGRAEQAPTDACCVLDQNGCFAIVDETEGNTLRRTAAWPVVADAVAERKRIVDLSTDEWYEHPSVRASDEALVQEVTCLNAFLKKRLTVSLPDGSERKIGQKDLLACLEQAPDGKYTVSQDAVMALARREADAIGNAYDGTAAQRAFTSTLRGTVWFAMPQPVGILVDREQTAEKLSAAILGREDARLEPSYALKADAFDLAKNGTYVEVDKKNQSVFVYVDGERKLESPCVTGLASDPVCDTPEGVFFIIDIQHDIHLRGYDSQGNMTYDAPVRYWMQFTYESDGFHDADWRTHFGGNDYLTNGSHGCVNLPLYAAEALYGMAYVGMPVYVF